MRKDIKYIRGNLKRIFVREKEYSLFEQEKNLLRISYYFSLLK